MFLIIPKSAISRKYETKSGLFDYCEAGKIAKKRTINYQINAFSAVLTRLIQFALITIFFAESSGIARRTFARHRGRLGYAMTSTTVQALIPTFFAIIDGDFAVLSPVAVTTLTLVSIDAILTESSIATRVAQAFIDFATRQVLRISFFSCKKNQDIGLAFPSLIFSCIWKRYYSRAWLNFLYTAVCARARR